MQANNAKFNVRMANFYSLEFVLIYVENIWQQIPSAMFVKIILTVNLTVGAHGILLNFK